MGLVIDFLALEEPADEAENASAPPCPVRQAKVMEPDEERLEPAIAL